jgi:hypothetical protein
VCLKKKVYLAIVEVVSLFFESSYKTELDRTPQGTLFSNVREHLSVQRDQSQNKTKCEALFGSRKILKIVRVAIIYKEGLLKQMEGITYGAGEL